MNRFRMELRRSPESRGQLRDYPASTRSEFAKRQPFPSDGQNAYCVPRGGLGDGSDGPVAFLLY